MNYSRFLGPKLPGRCDSSSRQAQAALPSELLKLEQVPLRVIYNSDKSSKKCLIFFCFFLRNPPLKKLEIKNC